MVIRKEILLTNFKFIRINGKDHVQVEIHGREQPYRVNVSPGDSIAIPIDITVG